MQTSIYLLFISGFFALLFSILEKSKKIKDLYSNGRVICVQRKCLFVALSIHTHILYMQNVQVLLYVSYCIIYAIGGGHDFSLVAIFCSSLSPFLFFSLPHFTFNLCHHKVKNVSKWAYNNFDQRSAVTVRRTIQTLIEE